jgi:hypothetical protein
MEAPAEDVSPPGDPSRVKQLLDIATLIIAPASVLSAMLYWFGWVRTKFYWRYFGVDHNLLGLSSPDYVLRSVDALFLPLAILFVLLLLGLSAYTRIRLWQEAGKRRRTDVSLALMVLLGIVLCIVGVFDLFPRLPRFVPTGQRLQQGLDHVAPLAAGIGIVLLGCAGRLAAIATGGERARSSPIKLAVIAALAVLALFWQATDYAELMGEQRARETAAGLGLLPQAVLYSETKLHISTAEVREDPLSGVGERFAYRYVGLRVLLYSNKRYFLVPSTWNRSTGVVVIVPDGNDILLEFAPPGSRAFS